MQSTYNTAFAILLYKVPLSFCPSFLKLKKTEYERFDFLLSSPCIRRKISISFFLPHSFHKCSTYQMKACFWRCGFCLELHATYNWWATATNVHHSIFWMHKIKWVTSKSKVVRPGNRRGACVWKWVDSQVQNIKFTFLISSYTHVYNQTTVLLLYMFFFWFRVVCKLQPSNMYHGLSVWYAICILFNDNSKGMATWHLLYP